jgi:tryptophan-rich sensory protein
MKRNKLNIILIVISILISLAAGFIGSFFTASSIDSWYSTLNQPSFNPPNWLFGPVWTFLYILIGISLYLVWNSKAKNKKCAVMIFSIQLALNALWSILFFGLQNITLAFFEILILWTSIVYTMFLFYKIDKLSMYLLIPYILWVSFATILNFSYMILN